jgi:hypothetical protein
VGAAEGTRWLAQIEDPDTFDVPRERLGRLLPTVTRWGCKLVWTGDVPKLARISSISLEGVGIERCKYFSDAIVVSDKGGNSSVGMKLAVPGSNSLASGLNEKCLGDVAGDRFTCDRSSANGGIKVVEDLAIWYFESGLLVDSSPAVLRERYIDPALELLRNRSGGKYETRPLNFNTSARVLISFQPLSISAYCSLHARYSQSLLMSNRGLLRQASSSNRSWFFNEILILPPPVSLSPSPNLDSVLGSEAPS